MVVREENRKTCTIVYNRHKYHLTMELSTFCSQNGIILYVLPPNTTHIMQPADVNVFKPLKSEWKKTIREWQTRPENLNSVLARSTFSSLLASVSVQKGFTNNDPKRVQKMRIVSVKS